MKSLTAFFAVVFLLIPLLYPFISMNDDQGKGSYFPHILLNEIQTMFSQLAKQSARVLPADLCTDHAHYVKNHRSTVLRRNKYCNYPLTTTQSDSCFASCENMVSPSQTSSLPPRTRPRDDDKFPLNLTTNTQDNKKTFENKGEDNTPNILLRRDALIYWVNQTAMFYVFALCAYDGILTKSPY